MRGCKAAVQHLQQHKSFWAESFCRVRPDNEQAVLLVERLASHAAASSRAAVQPASGAKAALQAEEPLICMFTPMASICTFQQLLWAHNHGAWNAAVQAVRGWNSQTVAAYTPKLPGWVRSRLPEMPEGWWAESGAWVPRDWALRPSYDTRVAIINALYACGENVQRLMPIMVAEAVRRDRFAMALTGPPQEVVVVSPDAARWRARSLLSAVGHFIWEVSADLLRAVWLTILFAPLAVLAPFALQYNMRRQEWMELLRSTLESAGPAFIKWGQWAATRHDLFPPDFCAALEQLHTQAPAHGLSFTRHTIQRAFDASVDDLFDEFENIPVASGSIGQVYRAKLSAKGARNTGIDAGTVVAVKVRHPGVGEAIQRDFALMMRVARLTSALPFLAHLRLEDTLAQFAAPLREQVDLALEARHLWQFNYNFRHQRHVRFPFPIYPLVAPEVLVETYEEGEGISRYVAEEGRSAFKSRLARLGSASFLQMMLIDNLIHSDLHPGNILVAFDSPPVPLLSSAAYIVDRFKPFGWKVPSSWREPAIVLLDVGMATHLSPDDQSLMLELFQAFSRLDGRGIGECTLKFSKDNQTCPDPQAFKEELQQYFTDIQAEQAWVETNGADAMSAVLELVRRHKVNMPGHICAVVVTTLVLEGWSSQLDPRHSVLEQVESIVSPKTTWSQRLGDAVDAVMCESAPTAAIDYA
ncbi:g9975 [Coccomyxa elongata]